MARCFRICGRNEEYDEKADSIAVKPLPADRGVLRLRKEGRNADAGCPGGSGLNAASVRCAGDRSARSGGPGPGGHGLCVGGIPGAGDPGIRQARETAAQDRTEAQSVLAELDELYAPDADFDGFTLLGVEAQEDQLIYYYMPADGPAYDGFDYRRGISVAVCTDPAVTLEQVCGQMGLTVGPDGFALDAEHDQLLFEQDGHTCSLQMPEGTDPETMKAFCRITTIPLN